MQEFLSHFTQMWALKYVRGFVVTWIRLVKLCCVRLYTVAHVVQNKQSQYFARGSRCEVLRWARLSVCPTGYLGNHTRDLYQFFCAWCLWPWLSPPPAGWRNPNGKGQFLGFWDFSSPMTMNCNAFAANNVMQQQKGAVMGMHSAKCDLRLPCFGWSWLIGLMALTI